MLILGGHRGAVRAVAYLPDGRLVSAGQDGRVQLHSPGDGEPERLFKSPRPVYALAVRPDGQRLAVSGRPAADDPSNPVFLIDPTSGRAASTLSCTVEDRYYLPPAGPAWQPPQLANGPVARTVWVLSWSADGRLLAAAVRRPGGGNIPEGGGGRWWDLDAGTSSPLPEDTYSLGFAPSGSELAVARQKLVEGRPTPADDRAGWRFAMTAAWAPGVVYDQAGERVAVAAGSYLYLHDRRTSAKPRRVKTGLRLLNTLAATPDGRALLVGGTPERVEVYRWNSDAVVTGYDFRLGVVHAVAVAPDGLTAAAGGDGGLAVFDLDFG